MHRDLPTHPTWHIVAVVVGAAYATILAIAGAQHAGRAAADDGIGDFRANGQGMTNRATLCAARETDGIWIAARCQWTTFTSASITQPADRTRTTMTGAIAIDTIHTRIKAAAAIIVLALIDVATTHTIAGQARSTGCTGEATWQINTLGGARCMRCSAALIHILSAGWRNAITLPAGITDATIAKLIAALHATAMST